MTIEKTKEWDESYVNKDNFLFYPNEEIIRFVNKYVIKKVGVNEFIPRLKDRRLLDLGCGIGRHVIYGLENKVDAVGVDLSSEAIRIAKEWASEKGFADAEERFFVGDVRSIPFNDNEFDLVVSHGVLDSMPFDIAMTATNELARVCKSGALFYCDLICDEQGQKDTEVEVQDAHESGTIQSYFSRQKVEKLFEGTFSIVEFDQIVRRNQLKPASIARYHLVLKRL